MTRLDAGEVRESAIETLAENLNDSVVAPLFWFCVAGLPGAWAWRAVNTLDAMWGYHTPRYEALGRLPDNSFGKALWAFDKKPGLYSMTDVLGLE